MADRQTGASALGIGLGVLAMVLVVTVSNIAVQYPINDWLTYGALTYPIAFLVTDLTNRGLGVLAARRVVYVGFRRRGRPVDLAGDAADRARFRGGFSRSSVARHRLV